MKRNIAQRTLVILSIATLYMGLAPALRAQDNGACSNATEVESGDSASQERCFFQLARFPAGQ